MKRVVRLILPLVLLVVATPLYAVCGYCEWDCNCMFGAGQARCRYEISTGCCYNVVNGPCFASPSDPPEAPLVSEYRIAAVELITLSTPKDGDVRIAEEKARPALTEIASITH